MFRISKKTILAGAVGNTLEFYDYVIWEIFSLYLLKEFLPPQSSLADLFFLFLITYIFRPLGSFIGGIFTDQLGRKKTLIIYILLMGGCTALVGLLPSYQQVGFLSVLLLVLIRILQVFAVGGEYFSSLALLIESCEKNKRGFYGSWAAFGVNAGTLLASSIAALFFYLIDKELLPSWGWRIAFLISFITMLLGLWLRVSIPESLEFIIENARSQKKPFLVILKDALFTIKSQQLETLVTFTLGFFGVSASMLIFVYAPIYMAKLHTVTATQSFLINSISLIVVISLIPIFGLISDKVGRIKIISRGIIGLLVLILPYFMFITSGDFKQLLWSQVIIAIPCACIFSTAPVLITELFPLSVRCSVTGLVYSVAASLGGGITPWLAFKCSNFSEGSYLPSLIIFFSGVASLIVLKLLHKKNKDWVPHLVLVKN